MSTDNIATVFGEVDPFGFVKSFDWQYKQMLEQFPGCINLYGICSRIYKVKDSYCACGDKTILFDGSNEYIYIQVKRWFDTGQKRLNDYIKLTWYGRAANMDTQQDLIAIRYNTQGCSGDVLDRAMTMLYKLIETYRSNEQNIL